MPITVTNVSYLTDVDELFLFTDENRIRELAFVDTPTEDPMVEPIPDEVYDRLHIALNWGRQQIDNYLRNLYDVSLAKGLVATVSLTSPGEAVKLRNARLTEFQLARKRFSLEMELKIHRSLKDDLKDLARANADEILGDAERTAQVLPVGTEHTRAARTRYEVSIFDNIPGASWHDRDSFEERTRE